MEGKGPYRNLYIYLVQGPVDEEETAAFGEAFLGNWVEDDYSFLFFSAPSREQVLTQLKARSDLTLLDEYQFTYEQWQGGSPGPLRVGGFLITPPWMEARADAGQIKMVIDPGVVFGSGLHPTTRDCLKAMAWTVKEKSFRSVLDLGTGTGILAVAAAFLGAGKTLALDINPLCVKTARRNVEQNDLQERVRVIQGRAEDFVETPADLVIANIHHEVIERLLKKAGCQGRARLIISGLMRSGWREVKNMLQRCHFEIRREWIHEMTWFTLLAAKPDEGRQHDAMPTWGKMR